MSTFRLLKQQVSVETVLQSYGMFGRLRRRGSRLAGPCPIHGGHNPTSFRVDLDRNIWHCFSACGGGDVVELVRRIEGCNYSQAATVLERIAKGRGFASVPNVESTVPPINFQPFTMTLPLDARSAFLQQAKGISIATAKRFEAGVSTRSSFLKDCVGVRLRDLSGSPLGYCGRRLLSEDIDTRGKWLFPRHFPKNDTLFNAHCALPHRQQGVIVVECPWAAMRLTQAGFPSCVALLGTVLSSVQREWLAQAPTVLLLLDGDSPGRMAADKLAALLAPLATVLPLPDGREPEDLTDDQLRSLISKHPSFFLNQSNFGFDHRV